MARPRDRLRWTQPPLQQLSMAGAAEAPTASAAPRGWAARLLALPPPPLPPQTASGAATVSPRRAEPRPLTPASSRRFRQRRSQRPRQRQSWKSCQRQSRRHLLQWRRHGQLLQGRFHGQLLRWRRPGQLLGARSRMAPSRAGRAARWLEGRWHCQGCCRPDAMLSARATRASPHLRPHHIGAPPPTLAWRVDGRSVRTAWRRRRRRRRRRHERLEEVVRVARALARRASSRA